MVDISSKIHTIITEYIQEGSYFTINRGRQYGKTTTLYLLEQQLKDRYLVIPLSFEACDELFVSLYTLAAGLVSKISRVLKLRGADDDKARRRFSHTYPLAPQTAQGDVLVQNLYFYQNKSTILDTIQEEKYLTEKYRPQWEQRGQTPDWIQREMNERIAYIKRNQYQNYDAVRNVNLANLSICREADDLKISFYYDERRCRAPFRRGHNKDYHNQDSPFYARDVLNETAFTLSQGQYGWLLWNERCTDCDEGTWYYQFHVYNLYYPQSRDIPDSLFTAKVPDHQYQQLASLY